MDVFDSALGTMKSLLAAAVPHCNVTLMSDKQKSKSKEHVGILDADIVIQPCVFFYIH